MDAIAEHVWQSTWFALAAGLLALFVRKDAARIRYWVWLAASLKFLVPMAVLAWFGNQFTLQLDHKPALLPVVQQCTAPLATVSISMNSWTQTLAAALLALWFVGSLLLACRWFRDWMESRALLRSSESCDIAAAAVIRISDKAAAPVVVGVLSPVIILPRYALALSEEQLDAVIAHELWHVRRRDNLFAALHALVTILFWFNPAVWWIGAKLVEEREHACDEGALVDGNDAITYAHALLQVCKHAVSSQSMAAASAAGGDLAARVRAITTHTHRPVRTRVLGRIILGMALTGFTGLTIASGILVIAASDLQVPRGAHSIAPSADSQPGYVVVHDDYVYARNVSMRELISEVYGVPLRGVSSTTLGLDFPRYDIELRAEQGSGQDQRELVAALLKRHFNLELLVRPSITARPIA